MGYPTAMAALAVLITCTAASAATQIVLPLSQYGALAAPRFETSGLSRPVLPAVTAALEAARQATVRATAAEDVEARAIVAAEKARWAGLFARRGLKAHGLRNVSLSNMPCHYAGELGRGRPQGLGVMLCGEEKFEGEFADGKPSGLVMAQDSKSVYLGEYRNGARNGLGGDYSPGSADAYEGEYKDGARSGFGVERDKDGAYPGRYGVAANDKGQRIVMESLGLQDFKDIHWAGHFGFYGGPKIACSLIQGAVLEGSVLDGYGAKFDTGGHISEQGLYRLGRLAGSAAPPC